MSSIQKRNLTSAVMIMMTSTIVSRLVGFVRELLIPNVLGANKIGDAYYIAFLFPDLMYNMLVGGAVAAALIPILTGYIEKDQEEEGWKAIGTFINVIFIIMIFVCILGIIFAPYLVRITAVGYYMGKNVSAAEILKQTQDAISLTRILFPSVGFLMLAGLTNGVLNSYNRFASAAYGPVIYNVLCATSILILGNIDVVYVAFGVMFSSLVYFLFQLSFAVKNLNYYKLKIHFKHPGFKRIFKLAIPSMIASSIVQVNLIVSSSFSTYFDKENGGNVVALNNANRTWQMPFGIFALGMAIAILPTLSAKLAVGAVEDYKNILMKALKNVLLTVVPCAVGLAVLSEQVIRTLFQFSSNFTERSVGLTAHFLVFFSIALIMQSISAILNRGFFANNDTKTTLMISSSTIFINMLLSYLFLHTTVGAPGMALSYSIASTINAVCLLFVLNRKMKGIHLNMLVDFLRKVIPAAVVMGVIVYGLKTIPFAMDTGIAFLNKLLQFIHLGLIAGIGAVVYLSIVLLLRVEEAVSLYEKLSKRAKSLLCKAVKS